MLYFICQCLFCSVFFSFLFSDRSKRVPGDGWTLLLTFPPPPIRSKKWRRGKWFRVKQSFRNPSCAHALRGRAARVAWVLGTWYCTLEDMCLILFFYFCVFVLFLLLLFVLFLRLFFVVGFWISFSYPAQGRMLDSIRPLRLKRRKMCELWTEKTQSRAVSTYTPTSNNM